MVPICICRENGFLDEQRPYKALTRKNVYVPSKVYTRAAWLYGYNMLCLVQSIDWYYLPPRYCNNYHHQQFVSQIFIVTGWLILCICRSGLFIMYYNLKIYCWKKNIVNGIIFLYILHNIIILFIVHLYICTW